MQILGEFFSFILQWYVWMPTVAVLGFLTWRNNRKVAERDHNFEADLLILEIPKTNDKQELAAEQMFASLHGILRDAEELKASNGMQEHLSFEFASVNGQIRFYVWVPKSLRSFVEGQIYSQYPSVQIRDADEDYTTHERDHSVIHTADIVLTENEALPIKTFTNFEVDPLAGITGTLAKLESTGDEMWVQIIVRPIIDDWHKTTEKWVSGVRNGKVSTTTKYIGWLPQVFEALWRPPEGGEKITEKTELSDRDKTRISEAEKKATKLGYQVKIRAAYLGHDQITARQQMQAIMGTFKQYNSTNLNGFKASNQSFEKEDLIPYRKRTFGTGGFV